MVQWWIFVITLGWIICTKRIMNFRWCKMPLKVCCAIVIYVHSMPFHTPGIPKNVYSKKSFTKNYFSNPFLRAGTFLKVYVHFFWLHEFLTFFKTFKCIFLKKVKMWLRSLLFYTPQIVWLWPTNWILLCEVISILCP